MAAAASAGERVVGGERCCWDSSNESSVRELEVSVGMGGANGEMGGAPKSISRGAMLALDSWGTEL